MGLLDIGKLLCGGIANQLGAARFEKAVKQLAGPCIIDAMLFMEIERKEKKAG